MPLSADLPDRVVNHGVGLIRTYALGCGVRPSPLRDHGGLLHAGSSRLVRWYDVDVQNVDQHLLMIAQVGADDAFDILIDANDVMSSPVGRLLKTTGIADQFLRGGEMIFPLARGLGLTGLPRPERFYFSVLPPVETRQYEGREDDDEVVYDLRDRVRDAIRDEIARLRAYRKTDREVSFVRRLINRFG